MIPKDNFTICVVAGVVLGLVCLCLFEVSSRVIWFCQWRKFKRRMREIEEEGK